MHPGVDHSSLARVCVRDACRAHRGPPFAPRNATGLPAIRGADDLSVPVPLPLPQWPKTLNAPLIEVDPELNDIIEHEKNRQWKVRHKTGTCWKGPLQRALAAGVAGR